MGCDDILLVYKILGFNHMYLTQTVDITSYDYVFWHSTLQICHDRRAT